MAASKPSVDDRTPNEAARIRAMYAQRLEAAGLQKCRHLEARKLHARPSRRRGGPDSPEWDQKLSRVLRGVQAASGGRRAEREARSPQAAAGPQGRPLETNTGNSSRLNARAELERAFRADESARRRYGLRSKFWRVSTYEGSARARKCGRVPRSDNGLVGLRADDGQAGFSGVVACGSPWLCAVCAGKIAWQRFQELQQVLAWADSQGHTVVMMTATAQHHWGDRLIDVWNAESKAWGKVTGGVGWAGEGDAAYGLRVEKYERDLANGFVGSRRRARPVRRQGIREAYGVLGFVRVPETLFGENGWHVHQHAVLVLEGGVTPDRVEELSRVLFSRWRKSLAGEGFNTEAQAFDLHTTAGGVHSALAQYFIKQLSLELTHSHAKQSRSGNRTPFELLDRAEDDPTALAAWAEWEEGSKGRRQMNWSGGLRELAGLAAAEKTDEEIAEADELCNEDLAYLDGAGWRQVRDEQVELLVAGRRGGLRGMIGWLKGRGIPYRLSDEGRRRLRPD